MIKKVLLIILVMFYFIAGLNHFIHPNGYIRIIPAYLPYPVLLNTLAGAFELLFAVGLVFTTTRYLATWGIILMLAAFLPVHIDMILHAPMQVGQLTVTPLIAWIRLLLQPLLMLWAWWVRR